MNYGIVLRLAAVALFIVALESVDRLTGFSKSSLVFRLDFQGGEVFQKLLAQNSGKIYGKPDRMGNFNKQVYIAIDGYQNYRISNAVTVEAWIKPQRTFSRDADTKIVMKGDYIWGISRDERPGSTVVHAYINGGDNHLCAPIVPDQWQHIVLQYDGWKKKIMLFINGALKDHKYYDKQIRHSVDPVYIGGDGSQNYKGRIEGIKIYNRSLSKHEIQSSFVQGATTSSAASRQGDPR